MNLKLLLRFAIPASVQAEADSWVATLHLAEVVLWAARPAQPLAATDS